MTNEEIFEFIVKASGSEGLDKLATAALKAKKALEDTKTAAVDVEAETKKLDLTALGTAGKGLFDQFKAGNLEGIVSGITSITSSIPQLALFGGAIAAVGAAVTTAWPILKGWYTTMVENEENIRKATQDLKDYTEAMQANLVVLKESDALAELRKADAKAMATPTSREQERAETLQTLLGAPHTKRFEQALQDITQAVDEPALKARRAEIAKIEADYQAAVAATQTPERIIRGESEPRWLAEKRFGKIRDEALRKVAPPDQPRAEGLLARARQGDSHAIQELLEVLPKESVTREMMRMASPEEQEANRAAKRDIAEHEQQVKDEARRAQNRRTAQAHVQASIKSEDARHVHEMTARAAAEARGPAHASQEQEREAREQHRKLEQEEKERPLAEAQRAVGREGRRQGVRFTDRQLLEGAHKVLDDISQQVNPRDAVMDEVSVLIEKMLAAQARHNIRLGSGQDSHARYAPASAWSP